MSHILPVNQLFKHIYGTFSRLYLTQETTCERNHSIYSRKTRIDKSEATFNTKHLSRFSQFEIIFHKITIK